MVKHEIILRGYNATVDERDATAPVNNQLAPPLIVKRNESDFVPALLELLRQRTATATLREASAKDSRKLSAPSTDPNEYLFLYQPVHRAFNLVVVEAVCARPGFPRLNPREIVSAGLVVRRVSDAGADEGWHYDKGGARGWGKVADAKTDPDPEFRPRISKAYPNLIHQKLVEFQNKLARSAERVHPLFAAPPEVCEQAKRTLLYGVVPVTSVEEQLLDPATLVTEGDVQILLAAFLKHAEGNYAPNDDQPAVTRQQRNQTEATGLEGSLGRFLLGLRALHSVWRVFDPANKDGEALLTLLNRIELRSETPFSKGAEQRTEVGELSFGPGGFPLVQIPQLRVFYAQALGDYLAEAVESLVVRDGDPGADAEVLLQIPSDWPFPPEDLAGQIAAEALRVLKARHAATPPRQKRFEEVNRLYRVRAFIRTQCSETSPPQIIWSEPSEPFGIMPWWANGGTVNTIPLPEPEDFKDLTPNVAFQLPPGLAALLNRNSPDNFLKGTAKKSGVGIGWICSFSIPIITLCAFIVLNIFLQLLNIVFQWMSFIKICLPFPKPASPPRP